MKKHFLLTLAAFTLTGPSAFAAVQKAKANYFNEPKLEVPCTSVSNNESWADRAVTPPILPPTELAKASSNQPARGRKVVR